LDWNEEYKMKNESAVAVVAMADAQRGMENIVKLEIRNWRRIGFFLPNFKFLVSNFGVS